MMAAGYQLHAEEEVGGGRRIGRRMSGESFYPRKQTVYNPCYAVEVGTDMGMLVIRPSGRAREGARGRAGKGKIARRQKSFLRPRLRNIRQETLVIAQEQSGSVHD